MRYETGKNATINGITYRGGDEFPLVEFAKLHPRQVKLFVEQRIIVARAEGGAGVDHRAARDARSNSGKLLENVRAQEAHDAAQRDPEVQKALEAERKKAEADARKAADAERKRAEREAKKKADAEKGAGA